MIKYYALVFMTSIQKKKYFDNLHISALNILKFFYLPFCNHILLWSFVILKSALYFSLYTSETQELCFSVSN